MNGYNFSLELQATLADAAGQAQTLNHEYIGTEHLLLALLATPESGAARALHNLGVDAKATAKRLLSIIHKGQTQHTRSSGALLPLTSRSKKVVELAAKEALALHHDYIGTEHLLLGMLAEGKGIAVGVLFDTGVSLANARAAILEILDATLVDVRQATIVPPANESPSRIAIVLEYQNGAIVSQHFTTTGDAIAFLEARGRSAH
jgi:ATP-dependent Clp protease ATP-binding subunit ClpC